MEGVELKAGRELSWPPLPSANVDELRQSSKEEANAAEMVLDANFIVNLHD
jgi:hypothetical protein